MQVREIKFRTFNGKIRKNYQVQHIEFDARGEVSVIDGLPYSKYMKINIIMQYTGLKDKNGEEIYEGDIVKGLMGCRVRNSGVVEYSDTNTEYRLGCYPLSDMWESELEVIGNIHENPELLEGASS